MVQELISNLRIAIAGAGPAGCACAKYLLDSGFKDITIFDKGKFLRTLLPTGGGRCNLAFAEFDFKLLKATGLFKTIVLCLCIIPTKNRTFIKCAILRIYAV